MVRTWIRHIGRSPYDCCSIGSGTACAIDPGRTNNGMGLLSESQGAQCRSGENNLLHLTLHASSNSVPIFGAPRSLLSSILVSEDQRFVPEMITVRYFYRTSEDPRDRLFYHLPFRSAVVGRLQVLFVCFGELGPCCSDVLYKFWHSMNPRHRRCRHKAAFHNITFPMHSANQPAVAETPAARQQFVHSNWCHFRQD